MTNGGTKKISPHCFSGPQKTYIKEEGKKTRQMRKMGDRTVFFLQQVLKKKKRLT